MLQKESSAAQIELIQLRTKAQSVLLHIYAGTYILNINSHPCQRLCLCISETVL